MGSGLDGAGLTPPAHCGHWNLVFIDQVRLCDAPARLLPVHILLWLERYQGNKDYPERLGCAVAASPTGFLACWPGDAASGVLRVRS